MIVLWRLDDVKRSTSIYDDTERISERATL